MTTYDGSIEYVSVPIPGPLVPAVFRLAADWLADAHNDAVPAPPDYWRQAASSGDEDGVGHYFWDGLSDDERRLLCLLADLGEPSAAKDVAAQLKLSGAELAGLLGPLLRRARQEGRPLPVRSRLKTVSDGSRRRVKVLSLPEGVADLVTMYRGTGEAGKAAESSASRTVVKKLVVRKRAQPRYAQ